MGENGDIARRGLDVFLRRSYEEAQRLCSADVELTTLFDDPGGEPEFSGRDGLKQWFERLEELWAFVEVRDVEIEELDGGWVLMRVAARVRGRGSRDEFEPRVAVAVCVTDGLITKFGLFPLESDALALIAAG
ncbi:MAG: nuclear transport factor 2 family protein [Vicinamibacteria bacterium]